MRCNACAIVVAMLTCVGQELNKAIYKEVARQHSVWQQVSFAGLTGGGCGHYMAVLVYVFSIHICVCV